MSELDASIRPKASQVVRRMLAHELRLKEPDLVDSFRWIDEFTTEDAEWFLAKLRDAIVAEVAPSYIAVFPSFIESELLESISTVAGLVAYVDEKLRPPTMSP